MLSVQEELGRGTRLVTVGVSSGDSETENGSHTGSKINRRARDCGGWSGPNSSPIIDY